jgi:hypothetical protein
MERLCPNRLHHAEGCWPAGTNFEFMATVMTCGQPRWTCVQRVAKREAVEVRRDGDTVWRAAATQTSA